MFIIVKENEFFGLYYSVFPDLKKKKTFSIRKIVSYHINIVLKNINNL